MNERSDAAGSLTWWDAAVIGVAALLAVLLVLQTAEPWRLATGGSGLALLVVSWLTLGRRGPAAPTAPWFVALAALAAGIAVAGYPTLAILQVVVYPIAWVYAPTVRRAIVQNIAVAIAVGVGFLVSLGTEPENLAQTAFTMTLSLGFSLAMGLWISRMTALGERNGALLRELQGAQEQIAALNRDAGAAAERERLARELHDTIAQDLTGLVLLAQRARRTGGDPEVLALIEDVARETLGETRALVAAGAPVAGSAGPIGVPEGESLDLAGALHRLAERFERETGVVVAVAVLDGESGDPAGRLALPRDVEVVVLRCAQEALANARKHARASRIEVSVTRTAESVALRVTDDGIGFDPAGARDGFGLHGMRDRLALVDGVFSVDSSPGRGAVLTASVPLRSAAAEAGA
ncbi:MAG: sensor histidine kinase [Microcella sp.]|uniref:sensor histidine kinase n=1 Tax=Microcella sp. TaxID=1913979 RepID=UPI0027223CB3|nr:sensor histidine kinase [Microcella sp.]MDO8338584.1 sensor histidine kinase [Microcella sp.]